MSNSRAQIIATIGPASAEAGIIKKMIEGGMDVVRLNLSWGTHEEHALYIETIRTISKQLGRVTPIILDLSGPRVQEKSGHHIDNSATHTITPKDLDDLSFGLKLGVEYVAMSYVGNAEDIEELKKHITSLGGKAKVIAKIEREEALQNVDEILKVSDAVMIARGDLGNEI